MLSRNGNKMVNVVFVISRLDIGGAEKVLSDAAIGLNRDASEYKVTMVCLYKKGRLGENLAVKGVNIYENIMRNKFDVLGIFRLARILKLIRPDILYMTAQPITQAVCGIASIFVNVPVKAIGFHSHNLSRRQFHKLLIDKLSLFSASVITCVSESQRGHIARNKNISINKIKVIYNGIDTNIFKPRPEKIAGDRYNCPLPDGSVVIGTVCSLRKEKGLDVLIKAMPEVLKNCPDAFFVIAGEGRERDKLGKMALELKVGSRIKFLGERQDIANIIPLFDIACSSSRTENFPLSILEYMACGKPVAATRTGGVPEMIRHGFNGILVRTESPGDLAKGILYLINNKEIGRRMAENGRRFVEDNFTLDRMIQNYKDFFRGMKK